MTKVERSRKDQAQYAFNLTLAVVAGQAGCLTLVIIIGALFGGLWLDSQLDTRPLFTLLLLIGSIPVTVILMFWVVRRATAHIKPSSEESSENQEDVSSGE